MGTSVKQNAVSVLNGKLQKRDVLVFLQYTAWGALACLMTGPFLRRCRALHILSAEPPRERREVAAGEVLSF